jgi:hypothetical protein
MFVCTLDRPRPHHPLHRGLSDGGQSNDEFPTFQHDFTERAWRAQ